MFSQETEADSLLSTLPTNKDTNYSNQLQLLYRDFPDTESKIKYTLISLELSEKLKYEAGGLEAYYSLAEYERRNNQHTEALAYLEKAEPLAIRLDNQAMLFRINKKKAYSLRQLGNPEEALSCLIKASGLATALNDSTFLADIYFEIGDFHRVQKCTLIVLLGSTLCLS